MKFFTFNNLGLKLLALALAIVLYHTLKTESKQSTDGNDRTFFHKH